MRISLQGSIQLPGDKSISHRYALLCAAGIGHSCLINYSTSEDCSSTLRCLSQLGVEISRHERVVSVAGRGLESWTASTTTLDVGNSGTTLRLLAGLLATRPFPSTLSGDASIRKRPMGRICRPLREMGASVVASDGEHPPLTVQGPKLRAISYRTQIASAQVKSCLLLAGLAAEGNLRVQEPSPSRDHTERALPIFGISVERQAGWISIRPGQLINPTELKIPGDLSAATFFIVGALLAPDSHIQIRNVGTNPTRAAFLRLLQEAGANLRLTNGRRFQNEPVHDLEVRFSKTLEQTFPSTLSIPLIPNLIDEIPALAILGTQLSNGLTVRDAAELRSKECDRIRAIVQNLQTIGVETQEFEDGFHVPRTPRLRGGLIKTYGDHRIAMAFSMANLLSQDRVELDDPSCVAVSDPGFFQEFQKAQQ